MTDHSEHSATQQQEVGVQAQQVTLPGTLTLPPGAESLVLFAHGSGSSRFSSRNRFVADVLNQAAMGTLLFDLLTEQEHEVDQYSRHLRFDIDLLTRRLVGAVDWAQQQEMTGTLKLGLFGASTGAAAALVAASERPEVIQAVVSRGGRPDLAGRALESVRAPTLLIVGELDTEVIALNREAAGLLTTECHIDTVPGASHLFEEPGTLERAATLARDWFDEHMVGA